MKKKNYLAAAIVLLGMAVLTGCGGKKQEETKESDSDSAEIQEDALDFKVEDYVKLGEYKNLTVTYPKAEVTDDDVEMYILEQVDENTKYNEMADRAAQEGDCVNIDYTGTLDGEEFEGGSDTGYDLILGNGEFLEEFENGLIGKKAGQKVTVPVTFPEDYDDEELAGKKAEFAITLNSVSEVVVPEYNDAFVKEISDYSTTDEYEKSVREELLAEYEEESAMQAGENALALAVENAQVEGYPQALYESFLNDTIESYQFYAEMMGMEYEDFLSSYMGEEDINDIALEQVNEYLVAQAIAEKEGLEITDKNYEAEAEALLEEYEYDSLEEFEADYGKTYIITQLVREKVIDFLYESAELQEVSQEEYYKEEEEDTEEEEDAEEEEDTEDIEVLDDEELTDAVEVLDDQEPADDEEVLELEPSGEETSDEEADSGEE